MADSPTTLTQAQALPAALAWLRVAMAVLFVLAVPLLIISTNVRALTEDKSLYVSGFEKYGVSQVTGLSPQQLDRVAEAFIAYFRAPPGRMDVQVELHGTTRPLFNERELLHMEDVQGLVHGFQRAQLISAVILLLVAAVGFALWRQEFLGGLGRMALGGAALTMGIVVLAGLFSVLDFQSFFVRFHLISFDNDYWILDPRRDYLIMLFPLGFWVETTTRLVLMTAAGAAIAGLIGLGLLRVPR